MSASDPAYEEERLQALHNLDILDTPQEQEFDELVQLAAEICSVPISTFTLIDKDRQWFKASVGVSHKENPRDISFCAHAIREQELLIVENSTLDARFKNNPLVTGQPGIRFYAGMPVHTPGGFAVGTLCVIDTVPRKLTEDQKRALMILARQVIARMELRAKQKSLEKAIAVNEALYATIRDRNTLFTAFMNNGPFVSYIKEADGRMIFYNRRMAEYFGVSLEKLNGLKDHEIWPDAMADAFRKHDLEVLDRGVPIELTEVSPGPDGAITQWRSYKFPIKREDGEPMVAGMSFDITEELRRKVQLDKALQEKLELAKSLESSTILFQTFVNNNPNICYFKSDAGEYLSYNAKFAELYGIDQAEWIGKTDHDVLPIELADQYHEQDRTVLSVGKVSEMARQLTNADGKELWLKSIKFPIRLADGRTILAGVAVDVTREVEKERALSEANAELIRLARTDALTGLFNRRFFEERMAIAFSTAVRKARPLSLIIMDVDNFKRRNDAYGHAAGDEALRVIGKLLAGAVRLGDMAARIGGEEFAILLTETDTNGSILLAQRIQSLLRRADCGPEALTLSIGIAAITASTPNWERLLSRADDAMYEAKRSGKNRFVACGDIRASIHQPK